MKLKFPKISAGWIWAMALFLLGWIIYTGIAGFYFTAYILWGCAALVVCYQLLRLLGKKFPKAAGVLRRTLTACIVLGLSIATLTGTFVYQGSLGSTQQRCSYIVVLGAGVNGTNPSMILRDRIDAAYAYLTENPNVICIASGGQGPNEDISEAQCIFDRLTALGIDPHRSWLEDKYTSTSENLKLTLDLMEEKIGTRPEQLGILSSEFHLFRAGLFAKDQGITAVGIPAQTSWVSLRINYFLREIVGVWHYIVFGG